jgi:hypothetical protein
MALSTLAVARRMVDAGFTQKQAEAQAEIWADIVESDLATKRDLSATEGGLKRDIKELDLKISTVEANLRRDIKELEANLKRDIKELELKMEAWRESQSRLALQMSIGTAVLVTTLVGFMIRFMGR